MPNLDITRAEIGLIFSLILDDFLSDGAGQSYEIITTGETASSRELLKKFGDYVLEPREEMNLAKAPQVFERMNMAGFKTVYWPEMKIWLVDFGGVFHFVPGSETRAFSENGWTRVPDEQLEQAKKVYNA